ncbi:MAG: ornithine carbamoyltransferase [Alphaproteobacteria bacterium]|jgi:ornithine carbamoyltransferase|nr:ornithine carbamoyltransferase [Alphaproteobacteria bacterium]
MTSQRHFLDLDQIDASALRDLVDRAAALKAERDGNAGAPLAGRTLAMVFEKPSTRTRISFEVGMAELGGRTVTLNPSESQMGRGETASDTARVLSRYVDAAMLRVNQHSTLTEFADAASMPVINGLSDRSHPCQILADILTVEEHLGPIAGKTVAWVGDGNNVAASWIHASVHFGFTLRLACPTPLAPDPDIMSWARDNGGLVSLGVDATEAVTGADCVVTDTWISMGDDPGIRHRLLAPYRVDANLMSQAADDAIFLHCLPAHRGDEVSGDVIDGPSSRVWDEAENRLHAQKAVLLWCLGA